MQGQSLGTWWARSATYNRGVRAEPHRGPEPEPLVSGSGGFSEAECFLHYHNPRSPPNVLKSVFLQNKEILGRLGAMPSAPGYASAQASSIQFILHNNFDVLNIFADSWRSNLTEFLALLGCQSVAAHLQLLTQAARHWFSVVKPSKVPPSLRTSVSEF